MTTTMNSCSLLLVVVAVATAVVCSFAPSPVAAADPCPWRTVAHPEDPLIQSLGQWAVDQKHTVFHFDRVESAKAQGVGQCTSSKTRNYELIIDASTRAGPGDDKYRAVVYVTDTIQPQKLISFVAIVPSHRPPAAN